MPYAPTATQVVSTAEARVGTPKFGQALVAGGMDYDGSYDDYVAPRTVFCHVDTKDGRPCPTGPSGEDRMFCTGHMKTILANLSKFWLGC